MKLAILSGTFNPIHKTHIAVAKYVKEQFQYDEVLIIPAYNPPLKDNCESALHRLNMVKLALENENGLVLSAIEYENRGKSYSYLTVEKLYQRYKIDGKLGFIIGTDAYISLKNWQNSDKLKKNVDFIVFEREINFEDERVKTLQGEGFNLKRANLPFCDISSSEIRKRLKNKESISNLVEKSVEEYIYENGLYK